MLLLLRLRLLLLLQVALVLDLDNTLVDATACSIAPQDWGMLDWQPLEVRSSSGRAIAAQYAPLPGEDPHSPEVFVMHWRVGRVSCTFRVRVRPGWADLRAFLADQADKYTVFVCSKGKSEYIQVRGRDVRAVFPLQRSLSRPVLVIGAGHCPPCVLMCAVAPCGAT